MCRSAQSIGFPAILCRDHLCLGEGLGMHVQFVVVVLSVDHIDGCACVG